MNKFKSNRKIIGSFCLGILIGIVMLIAFTRLSWHSKFYPGVEIAGIKVAGLTRELAKSKLLEATDNFEVHFAFNGSTWESTKGTIRFENEATLNEAYRYGRRFVISDYLLLLINKKTNFPLILSEGKTDSFEQLINTIASAVEIPPIDPTIELQGGKVKITNGEDGIVLDMTELEKNIAESSQYLSSSPVVIPTRPENKQLTVQQTEELQSRAEKLIGKELVLVQDDEKIRIGAKELISFLSTNVDGKIINKTLVTEYVEGVAKSLNTNPQDARFEISLGKVKEFAPGKDGVEIKREETGESMETGIMKLLESESKNENVEVIVVRTQPKVTTDKVNELGIRERIGRGESYYQHSIPNRIYNVALASSRLNSALIGPGEEVSFNNLVGEVSGETGYRPAYIISGGRTILGDGGGLCQVSTTMFRAVMSAGLPILERWGHAYRVSYYELNSKPGVDATVIAPSKDLKFKNDSPGHILIQTINDPKKLFLIIEIYGTSDGRVATISEPKVWGISPPLPTIYQDDPSLPTGTIKQVDWAASGAKASFEYKVVRNGETLTQKTFTTSYQPWASVFMRGTGI